MPIASVPGGAGYLCLERLPLRKVSSWHSQHRPGPTGCGETPNTLDNVTTRITGSVRERVPRPAPAGIWDMNRFSRAAETRKQARLSWLHYAHPGRGRGKSCRGRQDHLTRKGLGGRNQELACGCACIAGLNAAVLCGQRRHRRNPHRCRRRRCVDGDTLAALEAGAGRIRCFCRQRFHAHKQWMA